MVELRFYWDGYAVFEDEDENVEMELVESYRCETWEECCDECAEQSLDWNDDDLVTGESDCEETNREFRRIEIWDEETKEYKDAPQEIHDYYNGAVEKLEEEERKEYEKRRREN